MRRKLATAFVCACVLLSACGNENAKTAPVRQVTETVPAINEAETDIPKITESPASTEPTWTDNGNAYTGYRKNGVDEEGTHYADSGISNRSSETSNTVDYDNVEMGDNMLQAIVDGVKMTFYLQRTGAASDGYELDYVSLTPQGEANYSVYLRIPLSATAGSYSNSKGDSCYFSVSTRYNTETGKWGDSYRMVHYDSSTKDIGKYSLTLDQDMNWDVRSGSGSFSAELEGSSSGTEGKRMSVTNGVFQYTKGETHPNIQAWQSGRLSGNSETWKDPYAGLTDDQEKTICRKCGGTGKVICSYCDGSGTLLQWKTSIDLGSGSRGYWVEKRCACDNGYYKCSRCGGTGYE